MHQKEGLFEPSSVTLKSWAKEQFAYSQITLATTSDLKDKFQSLKEEILETQKKLADQHTFSLASAEARRKRKRKRDNASKTKQRKSTPSKPEQEISLSCCVKTKKSLLWWLTLMTAAS